MTKKGAPHLQASSRNVGGAGVLANQKALNN